MIEPQLLLELLVRLLANPTRLDGGGEPLEADVGRKIGEGVFAFARGAALAHQPGFGAGHMLHAFVMDSLRRSVGDPHANGGEGSGHRSLGSFSPTDATPFRLRQHLFRRHGELVRDLSLARASTSCDRKDQSDVGGIDLLMFWNADRPGELARVQPCRKAAERPYPASASTIPKRTP